MRGPGNLLEIWTHVGPLPRAPGQPEGGARLRTLDALGWSEVPPAQRAVRWQLRMRGPQPLQSRAPASCWGWEESCDLLSSHVTA